MERFGVLIKKIFDSNLEGCYTKKLIKIGKIECFSKNEIEAKNVECYIFYGKKKAENFIKSGF